MNDPAGIRALAVSFPRTARTNEYWRRYHADVVAAHERKSLARVFTDADRAAKSAEPFDAEMARYVGDPFRGAVLRRVAKPDETALALETLAARRALDACGMSGLDVDLAIVTSFLPDQIGVGDAAYLVRELGLRAPAVNVESTCSSALVALDAACALVRAGRHRNVLVVVSCLYSRLTDEGDTLSWFLGDGAGAFVVGAERPGHGLLGMHTIPTAETCGTFSYELALDAKGRPRIVMRASPATGRILRETAAGYLRACAEGAASAARLPLSSIDFFVFNTPTAWYAATCARSLGIDPARTIDTYPFYANVGPALMPVNLHHAAVTERIRPGDHVLVFTVGSVGTASAAVMRWGEVALGPAVADPETVEP